MKIWDLREGRLMYTLQGHKGTVFDTTFSSDGNFFASAGADHVAMVWKSNLVPGSYIAPETDWQDVKPMTSRQQGEAAANIKQSSSSPSPAKSGYVNISRRHHISSALP
jgi:WD40 repeat protein